MSKTTVQEPLAALETSLKANASPAASEQAKAATTGGYLNLLGRGVASTLSKFGLQTWFSPANMDTSTNGQGAEAKRKRDVDEGESRAALKTRKTSNVAGTSTVEKDDEMELEGTDGNDMSNISAPKTSAAVDSESESEAESA